MHMHVHYLLIVYVCTSCMLDHTDKAMFGMDNIIHGFGSVDMSGDMCLKFASPNYGPAFGQI